MPQQPPAHRRRKRPNYWLRRMVFLLSLLTPLLLWWGWSSLNSLLIKPEGDAPSVATDKPVYVALLGVDERKEDVGRSDTLMLLRLDPKQNRLDLISIPRDTRVAVDGAQSKINAAYSRGGADLTTQVMAQLLSIPRPYYVKVNFKAFEELVDRLGGVDLYVEKHYQYEDPYQNLKIDIPAGKQHLNGEKALQYVRLRYDGVTNSDIARVQRQQQFLRVLKEKLTAPANWSSLPSLISAMRQHVSTNIPEKDQMRLAQALFAARDSFQTVTLPGVAVEDGSGDWVIDLAGWKEVTATWASK